MEKILVVDDDPKSSKLLQDYLQHNGYQVMIACNDREALDKTFDEHPHAIIMDIMLPGKDGWKICLQIKQDVRSKHIPVIMSSSLFEKYDEPKGFEGADAYVSKPINLPDLLATVNKLLNR